MFGLLFFVTISSLLVKSSAYPNGINIPCIGGTDTGPTIGHGDPKGSLFSAGIIFKVDGAAISTTALSIPIRASSVVRFNVIGNNTAGIFLRLDSADGIQQILEKSFKPSTLIYLQYAMGCTTPTKGISHNSKIIKPNVETSFDTTGFAGDFRISISVVVGRAEYYYSSFRLSIDNNLTAVPTAQPTSNPTSKPESKQTNKPTNKPSTISTRKPFKKPLKKPKKPPTRPKWCFWRCPMKKPMMRPSRRKVLAN
jgi:hypothetical protein